MDGITAGSPLLPTSLAAITTKPVVVVGLGYVGLPVALAFDRAGFTTYGFDVKARRVSELGVGIDTTHNVGQSDLLGSKIRFTDDVEALPPVGFFVICVPTPVDEGNSPDLSALEAASILVGRVIRGGATVVYESTVYPGATEERCLPILERESGLVAGRDFSLGYSPERINPGDPEHRFETVRKVVAGFTSNCLEEVMARYSAVVQAGVFPATSIRVAEAAKVIENSQRDLNIAFVNELALICGRLKIDTLDVIEAASTKWNFLPFKPGLVGGHCISVDPFYLAYKAARVGYHSEVILAGRRLNDGMARHIAQECVKYLLQSNMTVKRVAILGLTFKENVSDVRNSKVVDIVRELTAFGVDVSIADPHASADICQREYGLQLTACENMTAADAVILAVPHADYALAGWSLVRGLLRDGRGLVFDIKGILDRASCPEGVDLRRL